MPYKINNRHYNMIKCDWCGKEMYDGQIHVEYILYDEIDSITCSLKCTSEWKQWISNEENSKSWKGTKNIPNY